tara:strand:+ start:120 stop:890 length:771 start_codon:yes stop_codon:yes gene_type:complete
MKDNPTLWVFGDSFSTPQEQMTLMTRSSGAEPFVPLNKTWTRIVSEGLTKHPKHQNYAVQGCSNEYIWATLLHSYSKIEKGDWVVVQATSPLRNWFWEDRPQLANHYNTRFIPGVDASKAEIKAIDHYQRHLDTSFLNISNFRMSVCAIQYVASQLAGKAKVLILPGFESIQGVIGNLTGASASEFESEEVAHAYYKKTSDQRYNHFSEENHKILADKVISYFLRGEQVDLTDGFITSIFDKSTVANIKDQILFEK